MIGKDIWDQRVGVKMEVESRGAEEYKSRHLRRYEGRVLSVVVVAGSYGEGKAMFQSCASVLRRKRKPVGATRLYIGL